VSFNLRNRSFLTLMDFSQKEIQYMLDLAKDLKKAKYTGTEQPKLKGKNVVLYLRRTRRELVVHSKLRLRTKELM